MTPSAPIRAEGENVATPEEVAARLNAECFCLSLDPEALRNALRAEIADPAVYEALEARSSYVFSARPVFIAGEQVRRMAEIVRAVEYVVALPAYREQVLASAPKKD